MTEPSTTTAPELPRIAARAAALLTAIDLDLKTWTLEYGRLNPTNHRGSEHWQRARAAAEHGRLRIDLARWLRPGATIPERASAANDLRHLEAGRLVERVGMPRATELQLTELGRLAVRQLRTNQP